MSLARELLKLGKGETLGFAIGIVTNDSPFTVQINGDTVDIVDPPLLGGPPDIGTPVFVLRPGPAIVVIGTLGGTVVGGSGFPITFDDGTYTYTIDINSGTLRSTVRLNAGSVLKAELDLVNDGTAYFTARDGEVVISSFGGSVQDARLDAGSGDAYVRAQSGSGIAGAQLVVGTADLKAEVDDGTYSQATFHVGGTSAGWAALFETLTTPAPDADLTTSDFTMWLDNTPGATKIMFKAKDSAGTVRTGSVALT